MPATINQGKLGSGPRILPSMPYEVLCQIASLIDQPTARSLATTCRALRDAGEMGTWRKIEVHHTPLPLAIAMGDPMFLAVVDRQFVREENILRALDLYPCRAAYVKRLSITPHPDKETQQTRFLHRLSPHLVSLTLYEPSPDMICPGDRILPVTPNRSNLFTNMSRKKVTFPLLRDVRVAIGHEGNFGEFVEVLKRMPALTSLSIEPCNHAREPVTVTKEELAGTPKLSLPKLAYLSIDVMDDELVNILLGILPQAPNLKHLDLNGKWRPTRWTPALVAIRKHQGLETIGWFGPSRFPARELFNGETLPNLTTLVETQTDHGEAMECQIDSNLNIPIVDKVKKYVILGGARPTLSEYALAGVQRCTEDNWEQEEGLFLGSPGTFLDPDIPFALTLRRAPDLTEIHFAQKHDELYSPLRRRQTAADEDFETQESWGRLKSTIAPKDWERLGWRGAVIRTFSHPEHKSRELVHIRVLTRSVASHFQQAYVGTRRKWWTYSFYRGHIIGLATLAQAYKLADMSCAFLEGGRNLTLPGSAWQVLDDHIKKANDMVAMTEERERAQYEEALEDIWDEESYNSDWSDRGRERGSSDDEYDSEVDDEDEDEEDEDEDEHEDEEDDIDWEDDEDVSESDQSIESVD